jgi:hypothetical protein
VDRDDGLQAGVLVVAEDDFFVTGVGDGFKDHWNGDSMIYGAGGHLQMGGVGVWKRLKNCRPDRSRGDESKRQV